MNKIVLCVDDSSTMQQVADITFRGTDFGYSGARSFEEALEKAKKEKPAIILVDATLPNKSGYDLCLALKSDPATANAPVVILIGNSAPYDAAKGSQVGADANLPKPWDTQTMLDKVTEIVGKASGGVAKPAGAGGATAAAATAPATPAPAANPAATAPKAANPPSKDATPAQPPRSSTIMGMPTIKMPPGVAPTVQAQPPAAATPPATATSGGNHKGAATAAASAAPAASTTKAASTASTPTASAAPALALSGTNRAPMISGTPTKRSALVEATLQKMAARLSEATGLQPGSPELVALLKLSAEVVERVVWEVVPELAEQIIRENLQDLTARRGSS